MKECKNDYINFWFLVNQAFKKAVNFLIHSRKIQKEHKLLNRVDMQFLHLRFMNSSLFIYKCIILHFMNTQSQDFVITLESFNIFASKEQLNVNFLHWPVS